MTDRVVTVGTTATKLLDIMASRKEVRLENQGAVVVYCGPREVATSGTRGGWTLDPNETATMIASEDPESIKEELYGIVAAGTCNVHVKEA